VITVHCTACLHDVPDLTLRASSRMHTRASRKARPPHTACASVAHYCSCHASLAQWQGYFRKPVRSYVRMFVLFASILRVCERGMHASTERQHTHHSVLPEQTCAPEPSRCSQRGQEVDHLLSWESEDTTFFRASAIRCESRASKRFSRYV
jgi:hypothetical protein